MKKMIKFWLGAMIAMCLSTSSFAQKVDEERMVRDIEVAENVLSTLIKQEINSQRNFFTLDIKGNYQPGYGVTFRLPGDYTAPIVFSMGATSPDRSTVVYSDGNGYAYSYSTEEDEQRRTSERADYKLREKTNKKKYMQMDSIREAYNNKVIKAAKDFIVDYGDFLSQLSANEKIVVTNQGEQRGTYMMFNDRKRTHLSLEASKADIMAFKQGKITRDQALSKIKVMNTETVESKEPDLELLSSIITRLYRPDLSKTFFTENNLYFERLKDYGVVYYMQVYSGTQSDYQRYNMPTIAMEDVDQATRDKKVVELYPKFEQEIKENIIEYGRTLKSLKDEEVLVFNVALTKCKGCGIPSTLELSVKNSVLKDFSSGKLDKNTALSKIAVKKGANQ